jgi:REP element-mobilizing transposase RayT
MPTNPNEPPMPEPIAYLITCATYGTWLPGDERGWVGFSHGWQLPDPVLKLEATARMTEAACRLTPDEPTAVHEQIAETCRIRGWVLHAVNCRTNHVHVVVTARADPKTVREQLKAWCTRKLKKLRKIKNPNDVREKWWAERGSQRFIHNDAGLAAAVVYVRDGQDR